MLRSVISDASLSRRVARLLFAAMPEERLELDS